MSGTIIGTATATATSVKAFDERLPSKALAVQYHQFRGVAGEADVDYHKHATAQAFGGTGIIGGLVGAATATAYSKSPFPAGTHSRGPKASTTSSIRSRRGCL